MKKSSKVLRKDYSKLENSSDKPQYYGLFEKSGRIKIDTKRYKKFFTLPNLSVEQRKSVYYTPTKVHRYDYLSNVFKDHLQELKHLWINEFSKAIQVIKTPKQVEVDVRVGNMMDGILDYDEACMTGMFANIKREKSYNFVIKSIYAQFFHQMMSQIDALCLRVCVAQGYQEKDFTKEKFDVFIQGKQKQNPKSFFDFDNYKIYDEAYSVWNFLKHNSLKAYQQLKKKYPKMIYDPQNEYKNGDLAIPIIKLNENYILDCLDNLQKFFNEVCSRGFSENIENSGWDYDDYFVNIVEDEIEAITNPLGLPAWV